jgi:NitT/TauT family transport system permease protein
VSRPPRHAGLLRAGVVAVLVLALEAACRMGAIAPTVLLPPSAMAASLWAMLRSGTHDADMASTFADVAAAALLAVGGGIGAGIALHATPRLRHALEPLLASWYAVPTFMFYPLFIVAFGIGSGAIVAIAFLLGVVAMVASTLSALDRLPGVLVRTARVLRLGRMQTVLLVLLPAIAPQLFAGVRLAVAYAFIGVIASEFILSGRGLGFAIAYAYNNFDNREMYGLMLLVVLVVTAVNAGLAWLHGRLAHRQAR